MLYEKAVLQGKFRVQREFRRSLARVVWLAGWTCMAAMSAGPAAAPPVTPLGVCEVLRDLAGLDGKNVAVLGRYSFRTDGRWIGEQACDSAGPSPSQLWMVEDPKGAPPLPDPFEMDSVKLQSKLAEIKRHTSLGKFPFGTPDYDRWAVVYGRVEIRKGGDARKAPGNLRFRGTGVVVVIPE